MSYIGQECEVLPYIDEHKPIEGLLIIQAGAVYQYLHIVQAYIYIFNEALWLGNSLEHTLIILNQLRNFGTTVQDSSLCNKPQYIMSEDT